MEGIHSLTTDLLLSDSPPDSRHSLVDLYTKVLSRLDILLQDDQPLSEHGDLTLFNAVNGTWLKVRTWGHDIDQENTNILGSLKEFAKPLAEDVLAQLRLIWTALDHLEARLREKSNGEDVDEPK